MISKLKLAWEDVMEVEPILDSIETNPALNQILAPNEPVALVTFLAVTFSIPSSSISLLAEFMKETIISFLSMADLVIRLPL